MKSKLERFRENTERRNVIEPGKAIFDQIKGKWQALYFENAQPITVEMGCGRGEYTVGLGRLFPERNFVGVDVKGSRIWKGSSIADAENLLNVAFLRIRILDIGQYFDEGEVDEIWITFPDPRPKKSDIKRRLTSPRFLELYKKVLKKGGKVHLKTDNQALFEYSLEVLQEREDVEGLIHTFDLYQSELLPLHHGLQTRYEQMFVAEGKTIKYLQFVFQ
jgi:tRNA (guanine-N7-)-methyltransferase